MYNLKNVNLFLSNIKTNRPLRRQNQTPGSRNQALRGYPKTKRQAA
jgi:hypothetical protein